MSFGFVLHHFPLHCTFFGFLARASGPQLIYSMGFSSKIDICAIHIHMYVSMIYPFICFVFPGCNFVIYKLIRVTLRVHYNCICEYAYVLLSLSLAKLCNRKFMERYSRCECDCIDKSSNANEMRALQHFVTGRRGLSVKL